MGKQLMHAVQYDSYGGGPAGLKHVEVPLPTPSKDEVLIKVEAVGSSEIVYKVFHRISGCAYTLKMIYDHHEESVWRQILRGVEDPNVVKCHEMYDQNN